MLTPKQFVDKWLGKIDDYDGVYRNQCVDAFKRFLHEQGLQAIPTGNNYADGYWKHVPTRNKLLPNFDPVYSYKDLRDGDWVIFPRGCAVAPYSHIGMYYGGKCFSQNQIVQNSPYTLINIDWSQMLVALRYKKYAKEDKSIDTLAQEVIRGDWGNGDERKQRLTQAGYSYSAVQARVNEILAGNKKSLTEIAKEVIRGDWGNGEERKRRLTQAGYDYNAVQARVNKMLGY